MPSSFYKTLLVVFIVVLVASIVLTHRFAAFASKEEPEKARVASMATATITTTATATVTATPPPSPPVINTQPLASSGINTKTTAGTTPKNLSSNTLTPKTKRYYISWIFAVYTEPDLKATLVGCYPPQTVEVALRLTNGWAQVLLAEGTYWMYMHANQRYLDKAKYLYSEINATEPLAAINPQVVTVVAQDGDWLQINTWLGPCWVDMSAPSPTAQMNVPVFSQRTLGYPTGCEIVSVAMMINYTSPLDTEGVHGLVAEMPRSDYPDEGFRGNPTTDKGFTVFPAALLALTEKYLGSAEDMTGCELIDLRRKLDENKPVVVWVCGLGFNVHALCLTGYDEGGFYYNDPWTGVKDVYITDEDFYALWDKPIRDNRFNITYPTRKALSY